MRRWRSPRSRRAARRRARRSLPCAPTCSTPIRRGCVRRSSSPTRRGRSATRCERPVWQRWPGATSQILEGAYRSQRGGPAADQASDAFERLLAAALWRWMPEGFTAAQTAVDDALAHFRAAPLSAEEEIRRAGQLQRFLALVPVEYARGVDDGRVTLDFEIQEAITFRDGASQAFGDLESALAERDPAATARIGELLQALGDDLSAAARGDEVAEPDTVQAQTDEALKLAEGIYPDEWKDAGATADFDVIRRVAGPPRGSGEGGRARDGGAGAARGLRILRVRPRAATRGLAPGLFVKVEGLFWYGESDLPGLAQLVKRRAGPEEVAATREALDAALEDAEAAVGSGPSSTTAVITNTAVIVFREGLEAVLILAALIAGMVGVPASPAQAAALRRRGGSARDGGDLGDRPDRHQLAAVLRREARGGDLTDRRRRPAADPELVLPSGLLERPAGRVPRAEEAARLGGARRCHDGAAARPRRAGLLERLPGGIRDRPLPSGNRARGRRRHRAARGRARPCRRRGRRPSSRSRCSGSSPTGKCLSLRACSSWPSSS